MGKAITNAPRVIALQLIRNSPYDVHTVTRLLVQASTSFLERDKSEETLRDSWRLIYFEWLPWIHWKPMFYIMARVITCQNCWNATTNTNKCYLRQSTKGIEEGRGAATTIMKYGQIAGSKRVNYAIYRCFEHLCDKDQQRFVRKFREQPHDSDQIMHTFRELILGA